MAKFMLLGLCLVAAAVSSDRSRAILTNDDVIQLLRAGFEEGLVLQAVEIHEGRFDLSPAGVANLRKAAVGERVIAAMLSRARSRPSASRTEPTLLEPGVYVKRGETYADVPAETVNWRIVSAGGQLTVQPFGRLTLSGRIASGHSSLRLTGPIELLIVCPAAVSPSEYRLLRAEENDDWREFRVEAALSGSVLLGLSGGEKYNIGMELDRSFDLGVRVKLGSLRKGEYGLIPPGLVQDGQLTPVGHIYTFTVD
jgi:hypothetical protein